MTLSNRILLADDEVVFLISTAELLRTEGFECDIASDAQVVREKLAEEKYDLLIADINMPGNSDLELIECLQQLAEGMPVILVTGYPMLDTAIQSIRLPVVAYLEKPVDFDELLDHVRSCLKDSRIFHALLSVRQQYKDTYQQVDDLVTAMNTTPKRGSSVSTDAFLSLVSQNINTSLIDIRQLTEALASDGTEQNVCTLLNCPRLSLLTEALRETIDVLESTKSAFKSKELGQLRKKLEGLVKSGITL